MINNKTFIIVHNTLNLVHTVHTVCFIIQICYTCIIVIYPVLLTTVSECVQYVCMYVCMYDVFHMNTITVL